MDTKGAREMQQHTVEIASYDGVLCSLQCTCGEERSGVNWEQAGHWFDEHEATESQKEISG
jgi:hypothetical protein